MPVTSGEREGCPVLEWYGMWERGSVMEGRGPVVAEMFAGRLYVQQHLSSVVSVTVLKIQKTQTQSSHASD